MATVASGVLYVMPPLEPSAPPWTPSPVPSSPPPPLTPLASSPLRDAPDDSKAALQRNGA
ncbi:hypothetical protein IscW_ISCW009039 [Ixodes scapularis]|uniref:Uncharacterized protein n=1 Tax=Ixodes scapularis TaxID=6945 RepID=B7PYA5_IXOSC|nr:hypothetical protein IscW_ISCW009039 [Ixodes scapularis]|eukprot:XP_002402777.1 hypothetical protein IscW_ISCW009039 [Ixodes scapularis]